MRRLALGGIVVAFLLAVMGAVVSLLDGVSLWPLVPVAFLGFAAVRLWQVQDLLTVLLVRLSALATMICMAVYSSELGWFLVPAAVIALLAALLTSLVVRGGSPGES